MNGLLVDFFSKADDDSIVAQHEKQSKLEFSYIDRVLARTQLLPFLHAESSSLFRL